MLGCEGLLIVQTPCSVAGHAMIGHVTHNQTRATHAHTSSGGEMGYLRNLLLHIWGLRASWRH